MGVELKESGIVWRSVKAGALAGFLGGTVSGFVLALRGKEVLFQLSDVIRVSSAPAGFVVLLVVCALVGAVFGLIFRDAMTNSGTGAVFGLLFGAVVWIVGPLTPADGIVALWTRYLPAFVLTQMQPGLSAVTHLLFGLVVGASYPLFFEEEVVLAETPDAVSGAEPAAGADAPPRGDPAAGAAEDEGTSEGA